MVTTCTTRFNIKISTICPHNVFTHVFCMFLRKKELLSPCEALTGFYNCNRECYCAVLYDVIICVCQIRVSLYLLTPWCRVLLEELNGLQLVKKFPAFHGTRRFITALTSVRRHLSLSWASPIRSIYPHPTSWRSILILSTHLRLGLPSGLFPSGFPTKTLYTPSLLTHTRHMPSPSPC